MKNRPIKILVDALNSLGGKIEYLEKEGFPPLKIFGSALMGGELTLDGGVSSQYISALMMIAPYMQNGLKIKLEGKVISRPYIEMTQKMMAEFGVKVDFTEKIIEIRPQIYTPIRYQVESDWSAASYWYEILTFAGEGEVFLRGLKNDSFQGDREVAEIYRNFGINTKFSQKGAKLTVNSEILPSEFIYDFTNVPDLAQTVVVTCCLKNIPFRFSGLQSLKIKETNRIAALINELKKIGCVLFEPSEGELAWAGERTAADKNPVFATYEDHRMAMALAPVGMFFPVSIQNPEVVTKSYPSFWEDIRLLY
jgi:3-phosphoshikimate 1-carboxyvinyltransferase